MNMASAFRVRFDFKRGLFHRLGFLDSLHNYETIYMQVSDVSNEAKLCQSRWLYCVECPQYSTRLEALGYVCDCVSRRVQR